MDKKPEKLSALAFMVGGIFSIIAVGLGTLELITIVGLMFPHLTIKPK